MKKIWLGLTGLFLVFCIIFVLSGVFVSLHIKHLNQVCTEETTAVVTDMEIKMVKAHVKDKHKEQRIFEKITYTVDGETYTKERSITTSNDKIGDELKICYNPNDPGEFKEVNKTADLILNYVFFIIGGIMGIIGVVFFVIGIKR